MSEIKKDPLNDWQYCNPENRISQLPMPFRIIDEILNEEILQKAYAKVFEIQKYDKDPNYDGNLLESSFQGIFDIDGISCISSDIKTNTFQVILGDKWGYIHILDLNKRQVLFKKQVAQTRIQSINCVVNQIQDQFLTTFSVIARGESIVQVFRYCQFDQDFYLHYAIKCNRNNPKIQKNDSINELPYISKLSQENKFLAIGLYNGEVEIFQLTQFFDDDQSQKSQNLSTQIQNYKQKEISHLYYKLKMDKVKKDKTFKQVFDEFLNNTNQVKQIQQETLVQATKGGKPDPKKQEIKKEVVAQEIDQDFLQLNDNQLYGEIQLDQTGADITPDYNIPKHRIEFYFIQQEIALPNAMKTFNVVNCLDITVGIMAVIIQTNQFQFHDLQEFDLRNAPFFLLNQIVQKQDQKKKDSKQPPQILYQNPFIGNLPEFKPQLRKNYKTIYPIMISQINQSGSFLALGLKDGSTLVWDVIYECENGYPDKFQNFPTSLSFPNDNTLILGSSDNQVIGYNIQTQNMIFKRTNQFRLKQQTKISNLIGSKSGVCFSLDESNTMRFFDVIHGLKILKIITFDDYKYFQFFRNEKPIFDIQNTQLIIVAEYQNTENNIWSKKTCILQYNIHNNLISHYPGLANLNRKGLNKIQLFNAFNKMSLDQLQNPSFEFKHFLEDNSNKETTQEINRKVSVDQNTNRNIGEVDMNSTFQSQNIQINSKLNKTKNQQQKLTQEILHPEKLLLSNINYQQSYPLDPIKETFNQARERNQNKVQRQQKVNNGLTQIGKDLELQEEKIMLENKRKNLAKIKT